MNKREVEAVINLVNKGIDMLPTMTEEELAQSKSDRRNGMRDMYLSERDKFIKEAEKLEAKGKTRRANAMRKCAAKMQEKADKVAAKNTNNEGEAQ